MPEESVAVHRYSRTFGPSSTQPYGSASWASPITWPITKLARAGTVRVGPLVSGAACAYEAAASQAATPIATATLRKTRFMLTPA